MKDDKSEKTNIASRTGRDAAIELAVAGIEKQFGKGAIMRLGDDETPPEVQVDPDRLAGARHRARHRRLPARPHRRDLRAGVVRQDDAHAPRHRRGAEARRRLRLHRRRARARRARYARKLGVKTDELLVSQPDYGEQALEIADMLVRSDAVDIVVVDSVAALVPKAEIEGDMGDSHVGLQARLMSQALRKLTGTIARVEHARHLHQPDPHEDRRHVRQPRDHDRRQRAQVLRLGAPRHPPHRRDQEQRAKRRSSATARA